jgi:hypothetical protein
MKLSLLQLAVDALDEDAPASRRVLAGIIRRAIKDPFPAPPPPPVFAAETVRPPRAP